MKVRLKNDTGVVKEQKVGFSWTTFFFGCWPQVFRGNWGEFFKWYFLVPVTLGVWGIVQMFTTNKKELIRLMEKGYAPATGEDKKALVQKGVIAE